MKVAANGSAGARFEARVPPGLADPLRSAARALKLTWRFFLRHAKSEPRTLSVRATVPLGDRRFVAVVQFERQRFLVGSSASSVTLLANLPDEALGGEGREPAGDEQ